MHIYLFYRYKNNDILLRRFHKSFPGWLRRVKTNILVIFVRSPDAPFRFHVYRDNFYKPYGVSKMLLHIPPAFSSDRKHRKPPGWKRVPGPVWLRKKHNTPSYPQPPTYEYGRVCSHCENVFMIEFPSTWPCELASWRTMLISRKTEGKLADQ